MNRSFILLLSIAFFSGHLWAQEEGGKGITMEFSAGYPEMTIVTPNQNAIYNGYSLQGGLIFPIASGASYSFDIDVTYTLDSLENNGSTETEAEWAHFNGFGTGMRLRLSYFEAGIAYQYLRGKHLRAGASTQIYDYNFNPVTWRAGINIPLSGNTSLGLGYSANLETEVLSQNERLKIKNQTIWVKVQIDFGMTFLNLFKVEESFTSTRGTFFTN